MTNYFTGISDLATLKARYKDLVMQYHPDRPTGDLEIMKAINNQHDELFEQLKLQHNQDPRNTEKQMCETAEQYRDVIERLTHLSGIEVELCGTWLWVSGETKQYKDIFKTLKMLWASKKQMWYWRAEEFKTTGHRRPQDMNKIREKYGSVKFDSEAYQPIGH